MGFSVPDKRYFKIGEVSKLAGVEPYVIRYWESEFDEIKPKRARSNQRLYRREDALLILKIKTLLHGQGYTIAGARKLLKSGEEVTAEQPAPENEKASRKIREIKTELQELYRQLEQKK